jgi:hypothetical protein
MGQVFAERKNIMSGLKGKVAIIIIDQTGRRFVEEAAPKSSSPADGRRSLIAR